MLRFLLSPMHSRHYRLPTPDAPCVAKSRVRSVFSFADPELADAYGVPPQVLILLLGQPGCTAFVYPVVNAATGPGSDAPALGVEFGTTGGLLAIHVFKTTGKRC